MPQSKKYTFHTKPLLFDYLYNSILGLHYTDTSHELDALQRALGALDTMGTTKDFTLQNSSASALAGTGHTSNSADVAPPSGGFGMKPVAPPRTGEGCLIKVMGHSIGSTNDK